MYYPKQIPYLLDKEFKENIEYKEYNVKYEIFPMEGSAVDYSVAHSSALFFFNKDGKLIDRITNLTVDNIAASIKKVMGIK